MSTEKVLNIKTGKMENCTVGAGCRRHAHELDLLRPADINFQDEPETPETKYYVFSQNNSGGVFDGPAKNIIIKAASENEANQIAEANGVYFDDDYEIDCECCGTRWERANKYFAYDSIDEAKKASFVTDFDKETPDFLIVEE